MSDHPSRGSSLKDQLFNATTLEPLAFGLSRALPGFDAASFIAACVARFPDLELKARIDWIAEVLAQVLPKDFAEAAQVIVASLPAKLDESKTDNDFGSFIWAPFGSYVARHGLADFDQGLDLIREITMRFSMEYAVRAFIRHDPVRAMARLETWATDRNYHVRRLVSEGTRPRLPWAGRLGLPPDWGLGLLDHLQGDGTRYVTRSVANHLNDIAFSAPDLVVDTLARWQVDGTQTAVEAAWMRRHALRGLVKAGHGGALALLGHAPVTIRARLDLPPAVVIGEMLDLSAELTCDHDASLAIDYRLHLIKARGHAAPKVFKWALLHAKAGVPIVLTKRHRLVKQATTFQLRPGLHLVDLVVNGQIVAQGETTFVA